MISADVRHLHHACRIAASGLGSTYPNPCVGALVVADGEICGSGRTSPTGLAHAEVNALAMAGPRARGATLYVSLEPCCHHGRTPPCTESIVQAGIKRVVVGTVDRATHVSGGGLAALQGAGICVELAEGDPVAAAVHEHYLHHVDTGRPWVTLKVAMSVDGRIACANGHSKWITGPLARARGHRERAEHHAIAVGRATLEHDDPALDVRLGVGTDPLPIVFDSRLRSFGDAASAPSWRLLKRQPWVLHGPGVDPSRREHCRSLGAVPHELPVGENGQIDVELALDLLGRLGIRSLLVEGGGRLLASFVRTGAWERLLAFQAPLLLGDGRPAFSGLRPESVQSAPALRVISRELLGPDLLTQYAPHR